jgi:hypothetical protein
MSKYADSRNNPINIGDKVRWRGGIYTIKKFFPKEGRMDTAKIEFMEDIPEDKLAWGSPDEISVDIHNGA